MNKFMMIMALLMSALVPAAYAGDNKISDQTVLKAIAEKMSPAAGAAFTHAAYDAHYVVKGRASRNQFEFSRIRSKESFPDNRFEDLAMKIAGFPTIEIESVGIGSRMKPSAVAHVYLYRHGVEGRPAADGKSLALLVIEEKNVPDKTMPGMKGLKRESVFLYEIDALPDTLETASNP